MFNLITIDMKKYLYVEVIRNDGSTFVNELKLSEAHFISQLAQENRRLIVRLLTCNKEYYKCIFG